MQEEKYTRVETKEGKTLIMPNIEIKRFEYTVIESFLVPRLTEIASKHNIKHPKIVVDDFGKIESIMFESALSKKILEEIRTPVELSFSRVMREVAEKKLKEQIDTLALFVSIGLFFVPLGIAATFYLFLYSNIFFVILLCVISVIAINLTLTNLLKLREKLKERDTLLEQLRKRLR